MPSLEDWLSLEYVEETAYMVRLFERRPGWLSTGKLENEALVWFDSDWPGLPLYLDYEEFTFGWNVAHDHLLWALGYERPVDEVVEIAIERIESVLKGRLLRLYAETVEGNWQTAGFITPESMSEETAKGEAKGWIVTVNRWPGTVIYRSNSA